jgi:hypothetical protein
MPSSGHTWEARQTSNTVGDGGFDFYTPQQWRPDWNTDIDYDAFGGTQPLILWYNNFASINTPPQAKTTFTTLADFSTHMEQYTTKSVESNGFEIDRNTAFSNFNTNGDTMLQITNGGSLHNTGFAVPNISDWHDSVNADVGAVPFGQTLTLGMQPTTDMTTLTYWSKH